MTQLIVSIDEQSMLSDIKKAIKMIKGVVSVKTNKQVINTTTQSAIEEAEKGNVITCDSFEDYKKLVNNL